MKRTLHLFVAICIGLISIQSVSAGSVKIKLEKNKAEITIDGEQFTTYNFAKEQMKPYFHPVYAPGKTLVVRKEIFTKAESKRQSGMDHFHHKGICIALDTVNADKLNYWHEENRMTAEDLSVSTCGDNATLHVVNAWLDNNQKPILKNYVDYTITPNRMIICEMKLTALDKPVHLVTAKKASLRFAFIIQCEKTEEVEWSMLMASKPQKNAGGNLLPGSIIMAKSMEKPLEFPCLTIPIIYVLHGIMCEDTLYSPSVRLAKKLTATGKMKHLQSP